MLKYRAAVLHGSGSPLAIEEVTATALAPDDVLVRIKASGLCHTDLEVMDGQLKFPAPIILGHEAAGVIEAVGSRVDAGRTGEHVVLSWNPHCGHCFYCDASLPILCEEYQAQVPGARQFDGQTRAYLGNGSALHHLMFLGTFAEYCIVPAQSAVAVPAEMPFDVACLIGCGVMTGAGGALNVADIQYGDTVMVVGCGAVGLSALQGARMAGARTLIAVDLEDFKLDLAVRMGATHVVNARREDAVALARQWTQGRGADVVLESAGSEAAFRTTVEAVRPGGQVIWLGKVGVDAPVSFRWGSLMGEKRIRRSSYGGARPARDFPMLARAYLSGELQLDAMITDRIALEDINQGFEQLRKGQAIRSVVVF